MADSIQFLSENRLNEFKFLDGSVVKNRIRTEFRFPLIPSPSATRPWKLRDRASICLHRVLACDGRTDGHTAPPMPKSRSSVVERDKTHIHQSFWPGSQWVTSPAPWRTWPFRIWQAWLIHNTIQNKQVYRRRYESRRSSKPKLH